MIMETAMDRHSRCPSGRGWVPVMVKEEKAQAKVKRCGHYRKLLALKIGTKAVLVLDRGHVRKHCVCL